MPDVIYGSALGAPKLSDAGLAALLAITCTSLFTFPLVAFAVSAILLVNLPASTPRSVRLLLGGILALSLSMMAGARPLNPGESNDIEVYYEAYRNISLGDFNEFSRFGGGLEAGLPTLFYLWSNLLPELSVHGLMFCLAMTSSTLFIIWIEKTFYTEHRLMAPLVLGIGLVMLNLYFSTQLVRQFISTVILLFAFTSKGRKSQIAFLLIACSFHLTAIVFFLLYHIVTLGRYAWVMVVAAALALRVYFAQLLVSVGVVPAALATKIEYYVNNSAGFTDADLASFRIIALLGIISCLVIVFSRLTPPREARPWLTIPWVAGIVHAIMLPIPLASLRTTFIVHAVAPGLIAYKMLSNRTRTLLLAVPNILVAYKVVSFATAEHSGNLMTSLRVIEQFFPA